MIFTKTKSQAKLEKEMKRREKRNIKNMIRSWDIAPRIALCGTIGYMIDSMNN
jgi:hypothetical protein